MRPASPRPLLVALVLGLGALTSACADPATAFDDFVARSPPPPPPGACPEAYTMPMPGEMDGDYFTTLLTSLDETPVYMLATVTTEAQGGGLGLGWRLQALNKMDTMMTVGPTADAAAVPVDDVGTFTMGPLDLTIVKEANPIANVDAASVLTFMGNVCGDGSFICGDVSGSASALGQMFDLTGSTFTLQRITDPSSYPAPLLDCNQTPLTPPM